MKHKANFVFVLLIFILSMSACSVKEKDTKLEGLEYTIKEFSDLPEGLVAILKERQSEEFKLTYEEDGQLYLCIGYGEQKTTGYTIEVNELYLSENAIYFQTSLIGPQKDERVEEEPSYPCLIVQMEYMDKPVIFQ